MVTKNDRKTTRTSSSRNVTVGIACAAVFCATLAYALPPEHEIRRLMLAAEAAVAAEQWGEAGEYLNRLQVLEGDKPADYLFYRGRVMIAAKHLNEARSALEQYVATTGVDGEHYKESLLLITDIEKNQKTSAVHAKTLGESGAPVATIEPAEAQSAGPNLKKLYLTPSETTALTAHLNNLLGVSAWRADQRLVKTDVPADVAYKIDVTEDEIKVQESRRNLQGEVSVSTQTMGVYGINPQVKSDCEPVAPTCWVYDPRDGSRLLQLGSNREQATEVAQTLGKLIQGMQAPG